MKKRKNKRALKFKRQKEYFSMLKEKLAKSDIIMYQEEAKMYSDSALNSFLKTNVCPTFYFH